MIRPAPVLLLAFLAAALARGAGMDERAQRIAGVDRPARAAFAFATLPDWSSAASGPLRPTNAPASGPGVLTIVADHWSSSTYGYTLALDGTYRFTVPFETTDMGWTGYALEGTPPPASMADIAALDVVICDPATGGNLVMLWGPDLHEQASIQGVDTDSPTISPFGSTSGTISISRAASGPPEIDLDEVEPLLPSSRNWYRSWLAATNPPAPPAGPVVLDALVLPAAGCVSPRRDADGPLVEVVVAEPAMLRALVQRYRAGLAPTNIPVNLGHDRSQVVGSVSDLWWVEGEGVWARLRVSSIGSRAYPSCEVDGLRAQATDAWGTWADFFLPWRIVGVGLVDKPALATPVLNPSKPPVLSPYPGIIR